MIRGRTPRTPNPRAIGPCALGLAIWLAIGGAPARAGISFVNMFRNDTFSQTSNGNTPGYAPTPTGAFLSLGLKSVNPNDYNMVTATFPGPVGTATLAPTPTAQTNFTFQTPSLASQAVMDASYPFGPYAFSASNGGPADTTSFSYSADHYPQSLPFLTGTDFTALQGMNPTQPFTFHLSPYVPGPSVDFSFVFLTVFDFTANTFAFNAGFLPPTTTTITLPASTLAPGHQFAYELDYSNRVLVASPGAVNQAQIGFDVRTSGRFTTAVPEPPALVLGGLGALLLGLSGPRRRATGAA